MPRMTPEQEAAYALDVGVARSDLPEEAQLAYDRLVEQRARARPAASASPARARTASDRVIVPRWVAAVGTALIFVIGQGGGVVLLPYAFTRWQPGTPWPLAVRVLDIALIAVGGIMVVSGFVRFAAEGIGIPFPAEPTSRRLTVGGPYRYVRNPLYLAIVMAVTGQALLFSRPVLLPTQPCSWPPLSRLSASTRSRRWSAASAPTTRPTASKCPAGGRAGHAGNPDLSPSSSRRVTGATISPIDDGRHVP